MSRNNAQGEPAMSNIDTRHIDSDGILELMRKLPMPIQIEAMSLHSTERVEEIVMRLGQPLWIVTGASGPVRIDKIRINEGDINSFIDSLGTKIGSDNRAGINGTLHRISVIRDRDRPAVIGATIRFGLPMYGVADIVRPTIERNVGLMVIGPPAVGKTTLLRDIIRIYGEIVNHKGRIIGPRVIYVDTASEMGGFGRIPHPSLGSATRIPVPDAQNQTWEILQGVGNHSAEVIIVDEIKTVSDAQALATSVQRGVKPVATCHGEQLAETLNNKTFWSVLGDIDIDPRTRTRKRYQKPIFGAAVEVWGFGRLVLHPDLKRSIDLILAGKMPEVQLLGNWEASDIEYMIEQVRERIEEAASLDAAAKIADQLGVEVPAPGTPGGQGYQPEAEEIKEENQVGEP